MIFGSGISSGFGSHHNHLQNCTVSTNDGGFSATVRFTPATGFSGVFGIYVNDSLRKVMNATENVQSLCVVALGRMTGTQSISVVRHGHISQFVMDRAAYILERPTSKKATVIFEFPMEIVGTGSASGMTSWSLPTLGINNTQPGYGVTRRTLNAISTYAGTSSTIELYSGSDLISSGSGSTGTTFTLTGDIAGTVSVGSEFTTGEFTLTVRYPYEMKILRGIADPPTTEVGSVKFTGEVNDEWSETSDLSSGTYYYRVKGVSDTGEDGTESSTMTVVVPSPPSPPEDFEYDSGNATSTTFSFTSPDSTSNFNLYSNNSKNYVDMDNPISTAVAGSSEITAGSLSYPGTIDFVLRSDNGIEEQIGAFTSVEYDSGGLRIPPRPNTPSISSISTSSGGNISVIVNYNIYGEKATGSIAAIYARQEGTTEDYLTADATGTMFSFGTIRSATLDCSLGNGIWYISSKAMTSGLIASEEPSTEKTIIISDSNPAAPEAHARLSRG